MSERLQEGKSLPAWSENFIKKLHEIIFSHESYNTNRHIYTQCNLSHPLCCFILRVSEQPCGCNKPAQWWVPYSNVAFCNDHITEYEKTWYIQTWKEIRTEFIYSLLKEHHHFK